MKNNKLDLLRIPAINPLPLEFANEYTTVEIQYVIISKLNDLITNFNNFESDNQNYTNAEIKKLSDYFKQTINELQNNLKKFSTEYTNDEIKQLNIEISEKISTLKNYLAEYSVKYTNDKTNAIKSELTEKYDTLIKEIKYKLQQIDLILIKNNELLICPVCGQNESHQDILIHLYNRLNVDGLTSAEYSSLNLTSEEYNSANLTARMYELHGKSELIKLKGE